MKRLLIRQMSNEWRDNFWIIVALTIVSLTIWVMGMLLWKEVGGIFEPLGFDEEDVYTLRVDKLPSESPEYVEYGEETSAIEREDRLHIMESIRKSPNVEAAAWSQNATPYDYSYYGYSLSIFENGVMDTLAYQANARFASPDIARVLRFTSHSGKTPEELAAYLRNNGVLVSPVYRSEWSRTPEELLGKNVQLYGDTAHTYRAMDIIDHVKRERYETPFGGTAIIPIDDNEPGDMWRLILRVKPGRGAAFLAEFDKNTDMQGHRNLYMTNLTKLSDAGRTAHKTKEAVIRTALGIMLIFLVVILLGLLGTFWFRVQQRTKEIAIRKVCGASSGDILRRVLGEGILLTIAATVLAGIIFWAIYKFANMESYEGFPSDKMEIINAEWITMLIIAAGVSLSLLWPSRKAMHIEPAIAIKDE